MSKSTDGAGTADRTVETLRVALSHRHRRDALRCLASADDALHVADLARDVARLKSRPGRGVDGKDDVSSIYVQLYHVHLPKLGEAGVVSFDAGSKTVSMDADAERVEASLDALAGMR